MKKIVLLMFMIIGCLTSLNAEKLYKAKTSGMFIKDSIELHAIDDSDTYSKFKVGKKTVSKSGIVCYYTLPKKAMSFDDQTDSSISCRQIGHIPKSALRTKFNILKKSKGAFFKHLVMDRIYDPKRNVLIYFTYTKKMSGKNASNSVSVVPILNDMFPKPPKIVKK